MADRLQRCKPLLESALLARRADIVVPGKSLHDALVRDMLEMMLAAGVLHGRAEMFAKGLRRGTQFNTLPEPNGPLPSDAITWVSQRIALQGKWQRDLDGAVTAILVQALQTGATIKDIMRALSEIFPEFGRARLENIARTEMGAAYTQGRLATFRQNSMVAAVQFAAILDGRTTDICRDRDGLVMEMDDPRLADNTPPLHYQCRSTLVPVDKYDLADLKDGDDAVQDEFFGWIHDGPSTWADNQARWDKVPPPLAGFGAL